MIRSFLLCTLIGFSAVGIDHDDDQAAVEEALSNYVTAIEDGRPELIEKSVHPELHKFGFWRMALDEHWKRVPMDFEGLVKLAGTMKENGRIPEGAEHSIELFEVLDQTASAKLTAFWGIDYMHLAKYEGEWKIVNVLWQSHPLEAEGGE